MAYAFDDACLLVGCAFCGAKPDAPCRTVAGRQRRSGFATQPHAERRDTISEIIHILGYYEDLHEAWMQRRAVVKAIHELHELVDPMETVTSAWLRIRLSEILAVR